MDAEYCFWDYLRRYGWFMDRADHNRAIGHHYGPHLAAADGLLEAARVAWEHMGKGVTD